MLLINVSVSHYTTSRLLVIDNQKRQNTETRYDVWNGVYTEWSKKVSPKSKQ